MATSLKEEGPANSLATSHVEMRLKIGRAAVSREDGIAQVSSASYFYFYLRSRGEIDSSRSNNSLHPICSLFTVSS